MKQNDITFVEFELQFLSILPVNVNHCKYSFKQSFCFIQTHDFNVKHFKTIINLKILNIKPKTFSADSLEELKDIMWKISTILLNTIFDLECQVLKLNNLLMNYEAHIKIDLPKCGPFGSWLEINL